VPLLAPCKAVMVVHGADWFYPDQARFYNWLDVRYIRAVMPLYFRKAAAVISVSELTTKNFNQTLHLPPNKVRTITSDQPSSSPALRRKASSRKFGSATPCRKTSS
jgi:hypothetical protein